MSRDITDAQARDLLGRAYHLFPARCAKSLREYLDLVVIDGSKGPVVFGEVAEPWQKRSLWPVMAAAEKATGVNPDYDGPLCFWRDLPAGHDKTSGIARILNGVVAFASSPIMAGCFAKDRAQAGRIWKFMKDESRLNPWLAERLHFTSSPTLKVRNHASGAECEIYDADYEGNAGHKLHLTVCEEITWWPEKGKHLYDQLYSRLLKMEGRAVFVVLGNAGVKKTWQYTVCQSIQDDPAWDYYRTEGPVASWMSREFLEKLARQLGQSVAERVIWNRWIDADEMAFLYRTDVLACVDRAKSLGVVPHEAALQGVRYTGSIDAAISKDYAVVCILGHFPDGTLRAASMDVLCAKDFPDGEIPLALIESIACRRHAAFRCQWIIDPYEMRWFIQKYQGSWPVTAQQYRAGQLNQAMATQVKTLIADRRLLWPELLGLVYVEGQPYTITDEFCDLVARDMPTYGQRWDHKANKHDDRVMALSMAAYHALGIDLSGPSSEALQIPKLWSKGDETAILKPREGWTLWGPDSGK